MSKELSEEVIYNVRNLVKNECSYLVKWKSFRHFILSEEFIDEFAYYLKWADISLKYIANEILSDKIIQKYINEIHWDLVSESDDITENFILKYEDRINFHSISYNDNLTENIIRKYSDKLNWVVLSSNFNLSKELIGEFYHRISFDNLLRYNKKISKEIKDYCRMFL